MQKETEKTIAAACRMMESFASDQGLTVAGTVVFTDAVNNKDGSTFIHQFKLKDGS